jgi:Tfp pilus assembly protein PilF
MNPHLQSAIDALQRKDLIKATVEVNQAIAEAPDCAEAYILRGQLSHAIGDKKGAAQDMARALELRPDLLEGLNGQFTSSGTDTQSHRKP